MFSTLETASATLLMRDTQATAPQVELTGGSLASPQRIGAAAVGSWPGQFRVTFGKLPEGRYRAQVVDTSGDAGAVTAFDVRDSLDERLNVAARPDLLRLIAQDSGGALLESSDASAFGQRMQNDLAANRPRRTTRQSAWDRWWVLISVFGLWASGWGLRRWSGLV